MVVLAEGCLKVLIVGYDSGTTLRGRFLICLAKEWRSRRAGTPR